jgi:hypothetical protein
LTFDTVELVDTTCHSNSPACTYTNEVVLVGTLSASFSSSSSGTFSVAPPSTLISISFNTEENAKIFAALKGGDQGLLDKVIAIAIENFKVSGTGSVMLPQVAITGKANIK